MQNMRDRSYVRRQAVVTVTRSTAESGRRAFIAGAGASVGPPAGLPLFGRLREYLITQLRLTKDETMSAEALAPEAFMSCLHDGDLPLESWLTATLSQLRRDVHIHRTIVLTARGGSGGPLADTRSAAAILQRDQPPDNPRLAS